VVDRYEALPLTLTNIRLKGLLSRLALGKHREESLTLSFSVIAVPFLIFWAQYQSLYGPFGQYIALPPPWSYFTFTTCASAIAFLLYLHRSIESVELLRFQFKLPTPFLHVLMLNFQRNKEMDGLCRCKFSSWDLVGFDRSAMVLCDCPSCRSHNGNVILLQSRHKSMLSNSFRLWAQANMRLPSASATLSLLPASLQGSFGFIQRI